MANVIVPLGDNGSELRVVIDGDRAFSILFSDDCAVVAETFSTRYPDHCPRCITEAEAGEMGAHPAYDVHAIMVAIANHAPECTCQ